jgi:L-aspartate oxidase
MTVRSDVLIIGTGIAGLFYALHAAEKLRVTIVTKKETVESNTNLAQGGIASVFSNNDSFELHIRDTITAGAGLCQPDVVEFVVREGPPLIERLLEWGVRFTTQKNGFDLGREGGHSRNRIVHAKDFTGHEIERILIEKVHTHPNILVYEDHIAIDLITEHNFLSRPEDTAGNIRCYGAYVLDKEKNIVKTFLAGTTMLATGGCGQVYLHTTNPGIASGDGVAMAYRAGARIANMEFIQFHPTSLFHPDAHSFLISEAVRGDGAYLRNSAGERFMKKYDERLELAPRDIVARAIDSELKKRGDMCVYLDLNHLDPEHVRSSFPNIYTRCKSFNIDITCNLVPVVPAAHYSCGGVVSDTMGRSNIAGLYSCGEVSMTGLHGANRLASNSLLEALVFAYRASQDVCLQPGTSSQSEEIRDWDESNTENNEEWVLIAHNKHEIQSLMWDYVGIVRSTLRLERALRRIEFLENEIEDFYKRTKVSENLIELRNLTTVAKLIIVSGLRRKESRGLHYTTDYPYPSEKYEHRDTIVQRTLPD